VLSIIGSEERGEIRPVLPLPDWLIDIEHHFGLDGAVQDEQVLLRDGTGVAAPLQQVIQQIDGPCMANDFLVILEGFSADGKPFLQQESGIPKGKRVPLGRRGCMGPEVADLGQQYGPDVRVQIGKKEGHAWQFLDACGNI